MIEFPFVNISDSIFVAQLRIYSDSNLYLIIKWHDINYVDLALTSKIEWLDLVSSRLQKSSDLFPTGVLNRYKELIKVRIIMKSS